MKIYNYDKDTKEFTGEGDARLSPLEDNVHLIPAFATTTVVNAEKADFIRVFKSDAWSYEAIPAADPVWKELGYASEADYDAKAYARTRSSEYPSTPDQFDLLYHDMTAGKGDATGEWYKAVKAVKDATPKP